VGHNGIDFSGEMNGTALSRQVPSPGNTRISRRKISCMKSIPCQHACIFWGIFFLYPTHGISIETLRIPLDNNLFSLLHDAGRLRIQTACAPDDDT
jgi:hypothetical protein